MKNEIPKNNRPAIFVDVDGTLIKWTKRNGRFKARLNAQLNERLVGIWCGDTPGSGPDLILWSRRGREYAKAMADKFDVAYLFCAIIGKPTAIIDDEGLEWMLDVRVNKLMKAADFMPEKLKPKWQEEIEQGTLVDPADLPTGDSVSI